MTRVGLIFDLRNPAAWRRPWQDVYGFAFEAAEEAERLGIDTVWYSEHHQFEDGYLSQPLTFAAAVAARTKRIRIGTAVMPAPFRNPVHLAEEAVVVDLVSNGRLELGLGCGRREAEFELFAADLKTRYGKTDTLIRELRRQWQDPALLPPPVQDEIPIWLGYYGPQGARRAGRLGEGLLSIERSIYDEYLAGLEEGGHDRSRARMKGVLAVYATEDPEGDWPLLSKHWAYKADSYAVEYAKGTGQPPAPPIDPEKEKLSGLAARSKGLAYGTPDQIAATILETTAGLPVEEVIFWASFGAMPDDVVMRNIATIANLVKPKLEGK